MELVRKESCFYKHTGEEQKLRSGCTPSREWIPQEDMPFCPFCSRPIKRMVRASALPKEELAPPAEEQNWDSLFDDEPDPGGAAA